MAKGSAGAAGKQVPVAAAPPDAAGAFSAAWRWGAVLWLAVWVPAYTVTWGWQNFLALCDVAVFVTCLGLWRGSPLLLSTQALPAVMVGGLWTADVVGRLVLGKHLIGGTEYMWDARFPLAVRLLSLFHVALPVLLVVALRRVGYDRRAPWVQTLLTVVLLVAARLFGTAAKNLNYAFRDPLFGKSWGPVAIHLLVVLLIIVVTVYLPTHLVFARALPRAKRRAQLEGAP